MTNATIWCNTWNDRWRNTLEKILLFLQRITFGHTTASGLSEKENYAFERLFTFAIVSQIW